ncbi:MAG: 3'-5' exonuclease [Eubacteriales bacterium]|nr:3'-5' exonuclease [Eubacteriales bacterium]
MLKSYIAFDIETTGLSPEMNEIIEIGALKVRGGRVQERFMEFIKPKNSIPDNITALTGITNAMVEQAGNMEQVLPQFLKFCEDDVLIGHNLIFDYSFVKIGADTLGSDFERHGIDTLKIAKRVHRDLPSKSLGELCRHYSIDNSAAHRAYHDALATAKLYQTLAHYFEEDEPEVFQPCPLICGALKCPSATKKQLDFLKRLAKQKGLPQTWNPETLTRNEASQLIDGILSGRNL